MSSGRSPISSRNSVPRRAAVNRARDQVLAGAAFSGDQHREVVSLHALNLVAEARHRRAGADETGDERLERSLVGVLHCLTRAIAQAAQLEALASDMGEHTEPPHLGIAQSFRYRDHAAARTVVLLAQ